MGREDLEAGIVIRCDGEMGARRYAVIGTGAIGGFYGAKLAAAGIDVTFLGRSDTEVLRRDGLTVTSVDGDIRLERVAAESDPTAIGEVDVVVVAIKTTGNDALAELLPALVGPGTIVVLLQNGFGIEAPVAALVPEARILGGLCFVCVTRVASGHIDHADYGNVTLAEHQHTGASDAVAAVAVDFESAGVTVVPKPDLLAARWQKLVWNMPFNGLSVVLDAGTDEMVGEVRLRRLVREMMDEVVAAAAAQGHPVGDGFAEKMITNTEAMTPYAPSMKLDYLAGRPLELAAMYDAPLAVAGEAGVATPRLDMLAAQLHFLDSRHR